MNNNKNFKKENIFKKIKYKFGFKKKHEIFVKENARKNDQGHKLCIQTELEYLRLITLCVCVCAHTHISPVCLIVCFLHLHFLVKVQAFHGQRAD